MKKLKSNLEKFKIMKFSIKISFKKRESKSIFNFFTKLKLSPKNELIIHPEFGGEQINFKINEEEIAEYEDETLKFINLDKDGNPIIKKNYYELLGVKSTAPTREIKINFLKIAKKYHPDKNPQTLVNYIFN